LALNVESDVRSHVGYRRQSGLNVRSAGKTGKE
jgi:hypothetical protein